MTVEEIVKDWLKQKGYDGLCNPEIECGCGLDDFVPCGVIEGECQAAKYRACKNCAEAENCENYYLENNGCYYAED